LIILIIFGEEHNLWISSLCILITQFSPTSYYFILLGCKYSLRDPVLK
jgi:hypothetical protein